MSNTKTEKVTQVEEPVVMKSTVEEVKIEEAPQKASFEEAPKAVEVKSFKKEIKKTLPSAKIILIVKDGCVAQDNSGKNYRLYGQQYLTKQIGEIIEVPERFI